MFKRSYKKKPMGAKPHLSIVSNHKLSGKLGSDGWFPLKQGQETSNRCVLFRCKILRYKLLGYSYKDIKI